MTDTDRFVTLADAAERLPRFHGKKISASSLWRWHRHGVLCSNGERVRLSTRRIGKRIVVHIEALEQFSQDLARANASAESRDTEAVVRSGVSEHRTTRERERAISSAERLLGRSGI